MRRAEEFARKMAPVVLDMAAVHGVAVARDILELETANLLDEYEDSETKLVSIAAAFNGWANADGDPKAALEAIGAVLGEPF